MIFRGHEVTIVGHRIKHDEQDPHLHYYHIRHSDEDFGQPVTAEHYVMVNHWGTIVASEPIDFLEEKDAWVELTEEEEEQFLESAE